jgi:hypothetical protein
MLTLHNVDYRRYVGASERGCRASRQRASFPKREAAFFWISAAFAE